MPEEAVHQEAVDEQVVEDQVDDIEGQGDTPSEEESTKNQESPKHEAVDPKVIDDLRKKVETLVNAENRNKKNPTPSNTKAVETQKFKLQEYLERNEFADDSVKAVAEDLKNIYSDTASTKTEIERQIEAMKGEIAIVKAERDRVVFDRKYPDLAGQYDKVMSQVRQAAEKDVERLGGHEVVSDLHWKDLTERHLERITGQSKPDAKGESKDKKRPVQTNVAAGRSKVQQQKDWTKYPDPPKFH